MAFEAAVMALFVEVFVGVVVGDECDRRTSVRFRAITYAGGVFDTINVADFLVSGGRVAHANNCCRRFVVCSVSEFVECVTEHFVVWNDFCGS